MTDTLTLPPAALAVSLLASLITVLAWAWTALMALSFVLNAVSYMPEPRDVEVGRMGRCLLFSVPAWAWLVVRYVMEGR